MKRAKQRKSKRLTVMLPVAYLLALRLRRRSLVCSDAATSLSLFTHSLSNLSTVIQTGISVLILACCQ